MRRSVFACSLFVSICSIGCFNRIRIVIIKIADADSLLVAGPYYTYWRMSERE